MRTRPDTRAAMDAEPRHDEMIPPARPSERPTQPTLPALEALQDSSRTDVIELSAGSLVSDDSERSLIPASIPSQARTLAPEDEVSGEVGKLPRWMVGAVLARGLFLRAALVGMLVATFTTGGAVSPRIPRYAVASREPLVSTRPDAYGIAPKNDCGATGPSRLISSRAQIGAGVDVSVADDSFAVGFADGPKAAAGVLVSPTTLKIAGRVRANVANAIHRVSVESRDDDEEPVAVHVDPSSAVTTNGGWISTGKHALWPIPGAVTMGFTRIGSKSRSVTYAVPPDALRTAARDEGGTVVGVKKGSTLYVGFVDSSAEPVAPLVSIARTGSVGTPAIVAWGGGAAMAWAERPAGERDYDVVVAALAPDGEGAPQVKVIGKGMSPSITTLKDGGLLVAYAVGASGAHRVAVRRLGRDLVARGEEQVVSPDALNAGQPALAIASDGRGLVTFFAADKRGGAQLLATPLTCRD